MCKGNISVASLQKNLKLTVESNAGMVHDEYLVD